VRKLNQMKLKILREHYQSSDGGVTWIPKRSFNSEDQIHKEVGFDIDTYDTYTCTFCNKLHISTVRDE
jgi:hypothetical protein